MKEETAVDLEHGDKKGKATAAGSLIAAVLASSCCIVPLLLVTLGASGAWIGSLTALEPYKPIFISVTFILLGFAYWQIYKKPKSVCDNSTYCAHPVSSWVTKGMLWLATVLVLLAVTIDLWAPLFY